MQVAKINEFFNTVTQLIEVTVGGSYLLSAGGSAKTFICSFQDPPATVHPTLRPVETARSRVETRIVSFVSFVGAAARFLDWGNDKAWFVITIIDTVVLKVVGHITGVFIYLAGCIEALDQIDELERLTSIAHHWNLYPPDEFDNYYYTLWLNYFSYLAFALGSGLQFASLIVGITVLSTTLNFLLTAGVICYTCTLVFNHLSADPTLKLNRLRSLDHTSQYSYITSNPIYSSQ